jgi:hypothetical protein
MAGGRKGGGGWSEGKEGMSSDKPFHVTHGKVATPVAGFENGLPGDPPPPRMRGDAKPITSWAAPKSEGNPNGLQAIDEAFGFARASKEKGKGK